MHGAYVTGVNDKKITAEYTDSQVHQIQVVNDSQEKVRAGSLIAVEDRKLIRVVQF